MDGVLRASANAVLFAATVLWSGKSGDEILRFQTSGTTGSDAESTTDAGVLDNHRQPFVLQFLFHGFFLSSFRNEPLLAGHHGPSDLSEK